MLDLQTLGGLRLSGHDGEVLWRRRNDLALLVVLADASPAAVRREELQALFWGERPEEKARHSLRQAVLQLRRLCGDALEVDAASIRLVPDTVRFDARELTEAAAAGRCRDAIELWTGDFMVGCEDVGAEGFRAWLDVERERLRRLLAFCYERTVVELEASHELDAAASHATTWAARFPLDERAHLRLIEILSTLGRIADATAVRATFERRLHAEMEEAPSAEWLAASDRALAAARDAGDADVRARATNGNGAAAAAHVTPVAPSTPVPIAQRRVLPYAVAAIAMLAITITTIVRGARAEADRPPVLAVGRIDAPPSDSLDGFATLLSITLARIPNLGLISEWRMSEVASGMRSASTRAAAQTAGAREILEGMISRRPDGALRADLRRTDLATGKTRGAYTVEGSDLTQLADLLSEKVARDLHMELPISRREGTTSSIVAYRFYEQGLNAYHDGDRESARRFFSAALAEDSTFAMAALYMGLSVRADSADRYMAMAARHAARTTERERLLIGILWGRRMADPRVLSWADTLATRYPSEPDAHLVYAQEQLSRGNAAEALMHFQRVVDMDSLTGRTRSNCRACDALSGMIEIHRDGDSLEVAERLARRWLRWLPRSPGAWGAYSLVLGQSNRFAEAHAAIDSAVKYSSATDPMAHTIWWFRANDYAAVDRAWRYAEQSHSADVRLDGLWTHVISAGTQGHMRDALAAAREFRRYRRESGNSSVGDALLEAVVLAESGHGREAGALYDSMALAQFAPFASRVSASRAWTWTHAAGAYAAAGDTLALSRLEDSVRVNGAVATERFRRLYFYVHGLRLAAQHKPAEAADAFQKAVWRRQATHVRIYLELGRALVAAGKPAQAIAPLLEGLNGPVSAAGLYATRTELQEVLASAYELSGQRDSAVAQYALVSRAWRDADPEFVGRRASAEARIAALTRRGAAR